MVDESSLDEPNRTDRSVDLGNSRSGTGRFSRRSALGLVAAAGLPVLRAGGERRPARPGPAVAPVASPVAVEASDRQATPTSAGDTDPEPKANANRSLTVVRDQRPAYDGAPVRGGALRLLRPAAPVREFSPTAFWHDFQVAASYLDPLVRADPVTMEPRPWLAERWTWSDEGRAITYTLRPDVRWHDGTPLTASDVRFSFAVYRDDRDSGVRNFFGAMERAEALDERTLRVTLREPNGGWLTNASTQLVFQRAQYVDFWTRQRQGERTLSGFDWNRSAPIGSGPWRIVDWNDDVMEFVRNEEYWAGAPHFERLSLVWESLAARRLAAWRRAEIDVLWPVRASELDRLGDRPGRLYVADAASVMFAAFNFDNPRRAVPDLFDDMRVRRALSLAINRERYATDAFGGFINYDGAGTIAQPWANEAPVRNPAPDRAAARALLEAAGWRDANDGGVRENEAGQPFEITVILDTDARPELLEVVRRVRADLAEVGVTLQVRPLSTGDFLRRWTSSHNFDLIAYAYDLYPGFTDFDLFGSAWDIRTNSLGWNPGGYRNADVDETIQRALGATDLREQAAALRELQRLVNEDLFGLWLGFPQDLVVVGTDVLGFQPNKLWQTWDTRKLWRTAD